jgi:hypothetical protein
VAGAFAHNFTQNKLPATNLNSKFKSEVRKKSPTPPLRTHTKKRDQRIPSGLWPLDFPVCGFGFGPGSWQQLIAYYTAQNRGVWAWVWCACGVVFLLGVVFTAVPVYDTNTNTLQTSEFNLTSNMYMYNDLTMPHATRNKCNSNVPPRKEKAQSILCSFIYVTSKNGSNVIRIGRRNLPSHLATYQHLLSHGGSP